MGAAAGTGAGRREADDHWRAAVAATGRAGTIQMALVDGADVCAAVRAYCDGPPFKSTGVLKAGCVRALAEAVQPRLERDWPATRARACP